MISYGTQCGFDGSAGIVRGGEQLFGDYAGDVCGDTVAARFAVTLQQ